MRDSGKVGIAKVVMRTKQYLVAIRPLGDALVMSTMNFSDEVVPQDEVEGLPGKVGDVSDRELAMASQLIETLSADFDPHKYQDTHREQVLALIERKAQGEEVVAQPAAEPRRPVIDLMAALEASLAAAKGDGKDESAGQSPGESEKHESRQAS
jgi:DNA end-binding protein Ku